MPKKNLIALLMIYLVSTAASFGVFSLIAKGAQAEPKSNQQQINDDETLLGALLDIDPNEARDQACPLNGQYYTLTEKNAWSSRRPLFVMIENTPDARPQSGLSKADVVFEAVAEGGVTRFGALYYCAAQYQDVTLAPVRSARSYFVDWASGFNLPMYVHVGGANLDGPADALEQIGTYGWRGENDIDQFSVGYPTFVRNYNRIPGREIATEHTMETTTEALWAVAAERGWTNITPARIVNGRSVAAADWQSAYQGWSFESETPTLGTSQTISYDFWSGYNEYSVVWTYDAANDSYLRSNGGQDQTDLNNDQQLKASTVIVLFTTEKGPIDEKKHMLYGSVGQGKALIFKHGQEPAEANWSKPTREAELSFTNVRGQDIDLARGQIWISVLATGSEVSY